MATDRYNTHLINDPHARAVKAHLMRDLKKNRLLTSVSTVATMVGGPLFAGGLMMMANAMLGTGAAAAATTGALAAVGGLPVVAMLAVGAAFMGIAVASNYMASKVWQSKQFDNFEINAQSTAQHIAHELQVKPITVKVEHEPAPTRSDGKTWQQFIADQRSGQQQGVQL